MKRASQKEKPGKTARKDSRIHPTTDRHSIMSKGMTSKKQQRTKIRNQPAEKRVQRQRKPQSKIETSPAFCGKIRLTTLTSNRWDKQHGPVSEPQRINGQNADQKQGTASLGLVKSSYPQSGALTLWQPALQVYERAKEDQVGHVIDKLSIKPSWAVEDFSPYLLRRLPGN